MGGVAVMDDPRILKPNELAEAEKKHGITLAEASRIVKGIAQDSTSTEPFDPMEREAIIFLGACWKSGIITQELFEELCGMKVPLPQ